MAQLTYRVDVLHDGKWLTIVKESREYCRGYMDAKYPYGPRLAHRFMKINADSGQETVLGEFDEKHTVAIGQVAGWPTAEQYESAAAGALKQAEQIRAAQRDQEIRRMR